MSTFPHFFFRIQLQYNFFLNLHFAVEYRQRGRFAGFSLFVSNDGNKEGSTLCYKDGPQLPPLNFMTNCTEYGRYVIFYNERKDGVIFPSGYQNHTVYTELCEVIVKGIHLYYIAGHFYCSHYLYLYANYFFLLFFIIN